jgi:hypothetical protein
MEERNMNEEHLVKRNRIRLGEPVRPPPTRGYYRKQSSASTSQEMNMPKKEANSKPAGGLSPSRGGVIIHPDFAGGVDDVMKYWRQLDSTARKEALAMMSLEQQRSPSGAAGDLDLWAEAVYEALRRAIGTSDGAAYGPQVLKRSVGVPSAWEPVADFVRLGRLDALRPAERYAMFRLLAKLLIERSQRVAERADIPVTPKLVAQNCQYIAGIFDSAFPGYLSAGLVGSVVRALIAGRKVPEADDERR